MTLTAILSLITFAIIVCPVNASISNMTVNIWGTAGSFITHSDHEVTSAGNDIGFITGNENYQYQSAGTHIVTLGGTKYAEKVVTDQRLKNTYDGKNELIYESGAAIDNTYVMIDNKAYIPEAICDAGEVPNPTGETTINGTAIDGQMPSYQSVEVHYEGTTADGGRYKSGGVINDANITTSMRAEGNSGGISANYMTTAQAGFNKETNELNFEKKDYSHTTWSGSSESGYDASFDLDWKDYSTPFETIPMPRVNLSTNNTTVNITEDSNVTETNELIDELFTNITP